MTKHGKFVFNIIFLTILTVSFIMSCGMGGFFDRKEKEKPEPEPQISWVVAWDSNGATEYETFLKYDESVIPFEIIGETSVLILPEDLEGLGDIIIFGVASTNPPSGTSWSSNQDVCEDGITFQWEIINGEIEMIRGH